MILEFKDTGEGFGDVFFLRGNLTQGVNNLQILLQQQLFVTFTFSFTLQRAKSKRKERGKKEETDVEKRIVFVVWENRFFGVFEDHADVAETFRFLLFLLLF